jgi:hypothetical protein
MESIESVDRLLSVAATLLDRAASGIRDLPLEPVRPNIHRIGTALAEICELRNLIFASRPDLAPPHLVIPNREAEANRLLGEYLIRAYENEDAGAFGAAISELEQFLERESSTSHREIAEQEIERLRSLNNKD